MARLTSCQVSISTLQDSSCDIAGLLECSLPSVSVCWCLVSMPDVERTLRRDAGDLHLFSNGSSFHRDFKLVVKKQSPASSCAFIYQLSMGLIRLPWPTGVSCLQLF